MQRYKQICLAAAIFASTACATTVCLAVEPVAEKPGGGAALSEPAPEQVWSGELDRYLSITDSPEAMSDALREEAKGIISKFRLMIGSSTYNLPRGTAGFDAAKGGARTQADRLLGLLKEMKAPAPHLAGNPEFARESSPKPGFSPDAARAEALKLLDALAGRLNAPRKISKPEAPGTAPRLLLKGKPFKPFRGIGNGGRCGAPVYSASVSPGREKVFKMKGNFEAEFPAWQWSLSGSEISAGGARPYSEGNLTPMGLYLGEIHQGKPAKGQKYKFHWKDRKGKPASQALAAQARSRPDLPPAQAVPARSAGSGFPPSAPASPVRSTPRSA